MKNRKGFTLIEVLSVIIIIGIILLIAFPAVNSYIDKANKGAYAADVQAYVETIKSEYEMKEYGDLLDDDEIMIVPIENIKFEKGKTESPYAPFDFTRSYILIVPEKNGYQFYSYVVDEAGVSVWGKTVNELNRAAVEEDFEIDDILPWEVYANPAYRYSYGGVEYEKCEIRDIDTVERVVEDAIIVLCEYEP